MKKSKYLKLTKAVIREMVEECNRLYFNGEIELPIKYELWTPRKKIVGMVRLFGLTYTNALRPCFISPTAIAGLRKIFGNLCFTK